MLRTIYGDPERFKRQYWSEIPHVYFTGDGCRRDKDGYFWIVYMRLLGTTERSALRNRLVNARP